MGTTDWFRLKYPEGGAEKVVKSRPFLPPAAGIAGGDGTGEFSWVFRDLQSGMIYHSYFITKQGMRSYFFVAVKNKKGIFARGLLEELGKVSS